MRAKLYINPQDSQPWHVFELSDEAAECAIIIYDNHCYTYTGMKHGYATFKRQKAFNLDTQQVINMVRG